jgi:hypothetical protein
MNEDERPLRTGFRATAQNSWCASSIRSDNVSRRITTSNDGGGHGSDCNQQHSNRCAKAVRRADTGDTMAAWRKRHRAIRRPPVPHANAHTS